MRWIALGALFLTACGGGSADPAPAPQPQVQPPVVPPALHYDVVIVGDSLIEHWWYESRANWPTGRNSTAYNAGVGGQTTPQMLARFGEVLSYTPRVVVIEGGVNDLYFNHTLDNASVLAMAAKAATAGACVVLVDILPADVPEDLPTYNAQRDAIAAAYGYKRVRAFDALSIGGKLNPALYVGDGFHLNLDGYAVFAPLIQAGIDSCP